MTLNPSIHAEEWWRTRLQDAENQPLSSQPAEDSGDRAKPASALRSPVLFNEKGLRAGWRFLIWLALCYVLVRGSFALFRVVRSHVPRDLAGDIIRLLLVASILAATALMSRLERRLPWSYGLSDRRWAPHFFFGVVIGWLALTVMLAGMRAAHHFYFGGQYMHGSSLAVAAVLNAVSFLFEVALFEEILFRGYALYTLADGIGFWPASLLLSLIFAGAHISNSGEAKVGIVAVVFFGLMLSFSIWRTGSLLWAIGFHFMWDYSESFLYGVPDSGFVSPQHLLSAKFSGPNWITGGSVGPEGSWFIFLVLALVALVLHFAYPQHRFEPQIDATTKDTKEHEEKFIPS